jgi:hypothetical protein
MKVGSNGSNAMAGVTENISRTGLTIRIGTGATVQEALPLVGDYCDVYLELPQHPRTAKRCLHCRAAIVWTRQIDSSEMQLGLSVDSMTVRNLPVTHETGLAVEENEQTLLM